MALPGRPRAKNENGTRASYTEEVFLIYGLIRIRGATSQKGDDSVLRTNRDYLLSKRGMSLSFTLTSRN